MIKVGFLCPLKSMIISILQQIGTCLCNNTSEVCIAILTTHNKWTKGLYWWLVVLRAQKWHFRCAQTEITIHISGASSSWEVSIQSEHEGIWDFPQQSVGNVKHLQSKCDDFADDVISFSGLLQNVLYFLHWQPETCITQFTFSVSTLTFS